MFTRIRLLSIGFLALFLVACANPTLQGPSVPTPPPSSSGGSSGSSGGGSAGGGSAGSSGSSSGGGGSSGGGSSGGGSAGSGSAGSSGGGMPSPGSGIPGGIPVPMPGSSGETGGSAGSQGQGEEGDGSASGESQSGVETGTDSGTGTAQEGSNAGDGDGSVAGGADIPVWEPQPSFESEEGEESTEASGTGGAVNENANVSLEEMEKTLEKAMGTFDEEILREQENARNQTGNNGSGTGARDGDIIAGVGEFESYGDSTSSEGSSGARQNSGPGDGSGVYTDDAPPPASDDDIVARQIREAAMSEPDPEQRAILWEEYERYKSGL